LVESLLDNHPLFGTPLFTSGVMSDLSQIIRLNGENTGLTATCLGMISKISGKICNCQLPIWLTAVWSEILIGTLIRMTSLVQVILKLVPRFITGTEDSTLYLETLCCPLLVFTQCGAYHFGNVISPAERYGAYSNLKAFDLPSSQGPLLSRISISWKG